MGDARGSHGSARSPQGVSAEDIFSSFFGRSGGGEASTNLPRSESPRGVSGEDIFASFFGGSGGGEASTNAPRSRSSRGVSSGEDVLASFFGGSGGGEASTNAPRSRSPRGVSGEDIFASFGGSGGGEASTNVPRRGAPIERNLPCSLEDLYEGTIKKMKISRDVLDSSGRPSTKEEILTIEIKPGWKKGTKITFPEKGNEQRNLIPSDLVFIIDEKPHSVFQRDGNDLIMTQKISLVEALTGFTVLVTALDGRNLTIPVNNIISSMYEEVVKGKGMPILKEPTKKGNLRIKFNIELPRRLTEEQKTGIKRLLTSS